jgi:uncharacterized protein (TIGR00369 family)
MVPTASEIHGDTRWITRVLGDKGLKGPASVSSRHDAIPAAQRIKKLPMAGQPGPLRCAAMPDDRVAWLNEFFCTKVPGMFGFELTDVSPERAEGRLTVTEPLIAGTGFLFAPVVIGMADFLCAAAIGPHLPDGASFTTLEVKTNFVSSAREGDVVTGEARPVHLGRTTQVWDATVTNATTGRLMALFRNTQLVLLPRQ